MTEEELHWRTGDGVAIFARVWMPGSTPSGVICLVHGLGEHSGRYRVVAQALTAAGYALLVPDLRGHGRSGGRRGHTPSYEALLDDVDLLLFQAAHRLPRLPRFLGGHSLGGNLALNYALRRKPDVAGIIALSPALRLAFQPPAVRLTLGKIMDRLWPSFSLANGLELAALSRDDRVVSDYRTDPLVHNRVSARMAISALRAGAWASANPDQLGLPTLIMHGEADRLTCWHTSHRFAGSAPPTCTFLTWEGFFHELHNEPQAEAALNAMIGWTQDVLANSDSRGR